MATMILERITGPDDERVADYRIVADGERLRHRGLFVAEGRLVVRRLIEDRRWPIRSLLLSDAAHASLRGVLDRLTSGTPVYLARTEDFRGITGYHIHRGCLALGERAVLCERSGVAAASRIIIALEGIGNPDNMGGIFRNASALGADRVLLDRTCCDPLYRKAIRTSMGATLRVPFVRPEAWTDALAQLRADGFTIVALTPRKPAIDLITFAAQTKSERLALLAGSEGAGLSNATEQAADVRVRIDVRPEADSLNVAVAVGIALHVLQSRYTR
jgi:tRNA G18 (ribose-2'-O)-methylase SpoU